METVAVVDQAPLATKGGHLKVDSLEDLIDQIHQAFSGQQVDVDHVMAVLQAYKSDPSHWRKYAKFDRFKYTRNLVDEGNSKFNVMLLCWGASHQSSIHDHSNAHCFMKMLSGSLKETRYEWPKGTDEGKAESMRPVGTTPLNHNEVCYINDSLGLHRVGNSSDMEEAVSLHVYCPPFRSCRTFDETSGRDTTCNFTFYSRYGEKVMYCRPSNSNEVTKPAASS